MSKFITCIPVDVAAVIAALPPKSYVHSVELTPKLVNTGQPGVFNTKFEVEVIWDNDDLKTAYTFPLPYPLEKLIVKKPVDKKSKKVER